MDMGLQGKVAIITGGGEGIGRAAAHRLAAEGANVIIVGRRGEVVEQTAGEIASSTGGTVVPVRADITASDTPGRLIETARERFGRLDILVNNAGVSMAKRFEAVSPAEWDADFDLKLWAAVELIRAAIPEMRRIGGGRIINVTNLDGRTPRAATMPTAIARAAGIALTKGLSKELAADNILVNTVCIGFIRSGQHERRFARQAPAGTRPDFDTLYAEEAVRRGIPLGRVGDGAEAGDIIAFLASARASYVTGVAINIDGGLSAVV
jgi:3-oxoacyl-[acyl-carrier protein] reductase